MRQNIDLIERFYAAFQRRDGAEMGRCYHKNARFTDPAFDLQGEEIGAMWTMLCTRGKDLNLTFSDVEADKQRGSARWIARYTFSGTGRKVVNNVRSEFRFEDGLIIEQSDHFPFYAWARQALGPIGLVLGWSGFLRRKVQATARENLNKFMASR